ncbi:MAG: hydroxyphenylacetyl-CoA thioesterase PaaI [Bacteroidia bacterium]
MTAQEIVQTMMEKDFFSQWLGIEVLELHAGFCKLEMTIRKEMLNGFGIAHGGISYALADSALAFAANSHGRKAVSVETSISHTIPLKEGDKIVATAEESALSNRIGIYHITVSNEKGEKIALFKGTVYRTDKNWEEIS